ncbi:hypothetical protein EsH8_IV_001354 [Colletotrichum jinshuiense]
MKQIFSATTFILLAATVAIVNGLNFTNPNQYKVLDLSAPILVGWENESTNSNAHGTLFDLWWHGRHASGSTFGYELQENLTVTTGAYDWNPTSIVEALSSQNNTLSSDKEFYFEARIHRQNGSSIETTIQSEKYAVTGYNRIGSSGNLLKPVWQLASASIVLMAILV